MVESRINKEYHLNTWAKGVVYALENLSIGENPNECEISDLDQAAHFLDSVIKGQESADPSPIDSVNYDWFTKSLQGLDVQKYREIATAVAHAAKAGLSVDNKTALKELTDLFKSLKECKLILIEGTPPTS